MSITQNSLVLSVLSISLIPLKLSAHDTNVTHPVLSLQAVRLIENKDQGTGAFAELYRNTSSSEAIGVGDNQLKGFRYQQSNCHRPL